MENKILLGDFGTIENKTLVEKQIFNKIKPKVGSWRGRCEQKKVEKPYKSVSFRTLVMPKAPNYENCILKEGLVPDPKGGLTYVERKILLEPLGSYATYTDQDMLFGFDNIVGDLTEQIIYQGEDIIDQIAFKAWVNGNNVWKFTSGLTREDLMKIRINLRKFSRKKDAKVRLILPPEATANLRVKYKDLFTDTTLNDASVKDGVIARFEGLDIEEDDSDSMYIRNANGDVTGFYGFAYILDSQGRKPVSLTSTENNYEFIAKGLGSAGTNDPVNQLGSLGFKLNGMGSMLTSEECLIRLEITPQSGEISYVEADYDYVTGNALSNGKEVAIGGEKASSPKPLILNATLKDLSISGTKTSTISAKDINGKAVTSFKLTSSDTSIATVSGTTVTGVKVGKVTIFASSNDGATGSILLNIKA